MRFIKMHGLGNDFVILDLRDGTLLPEKSRLAALTNRKTGIGADQVIVILPPGNPQVDARMRIFNAPDASEAESCGNATRCVALLLMDEMKKDMVVIETMAGRLPSWRELDGRITVDMGKPRFGWQDIPLSKETDTLHLGIGEGNVNDPVGVNVGNPHAVFFVDDVKKLPVEKLGPRFETDKLFPKRANIEFIQVESPKILHMRVWERDAGETHACGSGACAAHVAAVRRGLADRKARVNLPGGPLDFYWREEDDHILMTGPAVAVFDGILKDV